MFGFTNYFYRAARSLQCTRLPNTASKRMVCSKGIGFQKANKPCKKLRGSPCGEPELQFKKKTNKPKQRKSMWLNPFCDETDPTCPINARFDELYYTESDKANRKYWQTWVSCPPLQMKKKKICCFPKSQAPVMRRRGRKPQTACPQPPRCVTQPECPRFKRRCDRAGRIPPSCPNERPPKDCVKPQTPYPAFSECHRLTPNAPALSECLCWQKPMLCEAWVEFRKRNMNNSKK